MKKIWNNPSCTSWTNIKIQLHPVRGSYYFLSLLLRSAASVSFPQQISQNSARRWAFQLSLHPHFDKWGRCPSDVRFLFFVAATISGRQPLLYRIFINPPPPLQPGLLDVVRQLLLNL